MWITSSCHTKWSLENKVTCLLCVPLDNDYDILLDFGIKQDYVASKGPKSQTTPRAPKSLGNYP